MSALARRAAGSRGSGSQLVDTCDRSDEPWSKGPRDGRACEAGCEQGDRRLVERGQKGDYRSAESIVRQHATRKPLPRKAPAVHIPAHAANFVGIWRAKK